MRISQRAPLAALAIAALITFQTPLAASAAPNGKTSTTEIMAGTGLVYYLAKLHIDNAKADATGKAADQVIEINRRLNPARKEIPGTSLRDIRTTLLHHVAVATDSSGQWRTNFENFRTCWNLFIFAQPASKQAPQSPKATPQTGGASPSRGSPASTALAAAPTGAPPAKTGSDAASTADSCVAGFDKIDVALNKSNDSTVDFTDLASAMNSAPTLYQQVLDLKVGSHRDDDDLRAHYLYFAALAIDQQIPLPPSLQSASGAIDVSGIAKSCIFSLTDAMACVTALGTAESTAAADRRQDVACDIARRSWLPTFTAIRRTYKDWSANPAGKSKPDDGSYGAVPIC